MDDVAVCRERVSLGARRQRIGRRRLLDSWRFGVPADRRAHRLHLAYRNAHDLIDGVRKGPVRTGAKQRLVVFSDRLAQTEDDGLFLRPDGEESRTKENNNHYY